MQNLGTTPIVLYDLLKKINDRGIKLTPLRARERVYKLAKYSDQEIAIGSLEDTKAAADLGFRRLNDPDWTPAVNEAWVQGAIDGRKKLYLSTPQTREYLFDTKNKRNTMFKREIDQAKLNDYIEEGDYLFPPPKQ